MDPGAEVFHGRWLPGLFLFHPCQVEQQQLPGQPTLEPWTSFKSGLHSAVTAAEKQVELLFFLRDGDFLMLDLNCQVLEFVPKSFVVII